MSQTRPEIDEAARRAWVDQIVAAPAPADALLKALEELDARQDIATQAALFETVLSRVEVRHYWVYFRISHVYAGLGREDASFQWAAQAVQMHPDWDASHSPFQNVFRFLARRGDARAALDVFLRQVGFFPEKPIAHRHEVEPLLRALGVDPQLSSPAAQPPQADPSPAPPAAPARVAHRVADAEQRPPTRVRVMAGTLPPGLAGMSGVLTREAIDVVELAGGELLVCNDTVVVRDAAGAIQEDLSVGAYPELIARRVLNRPGARAWSSTRPRRRCCSWTPSRRPICVISCSIRSPGWSCTAAPAQILAAALAVGPELRTDYQRAIAARAGMTRVLGTARVARVRARRLWVSTDCRALQHPAHYGAGWAIEHARAVLGGRGTVGSRRLYLSRADSKTRQVQNEAALVAALARFGFETIVPGAMTYEAQLAAFRAASHIVAPHGAALAHIVLCPPGARVLELFHPMVRHVVVCSAGRLMRPRLHGAARPRWPVGCAGAERPGAS